MTDWEETPFREVVQFAIGGGWGSEGPQEGHTEVVVIRGTDFENARFGDSRGAPRRFEKTSKLPKRLLREGDILLEMAGGSPTSNQPTGRSLLVDEKLLSLGPVIPASFCRRIQIDRDRAEPKFAYYWLQDMYASGRAFLYQVQSTGIANFQFEYFLDAETAFLPPLPEQRAIAGILGALDDKIGLNRRMNETLEAMARAIFKSWFVDFDPVRAKMEGRQPFGMDQATAALFPDRLVESEIGLIPEGWEVSCLGDLCDLVKDKTEPEDVDPGTRYVGLEHIPKRSFSMSESGIAAEVSSAKTRFAAGDTLFGKLRPYFHKVAPAFTDGICSTDILALRPKSPKHSAAALFTSSLDSCVEYATRYSTGTRMPRANWKDLAKFPVAMSQVILPLLADSTDIKLKQIAQNLEESRTLAELRDLLLPKLLSGEIRVADAEKEAEAAL